jgi:hypothetical protein
VSNEANRRRYARIRAPVFCRPIGKPFFGPKQEPIDISAGGLRIYADEPMTPGDRLEIELFLPDATTVVSEVEIVWVDQLPEGSPARFDMGLKFLEGSEEQMERLTAVLEQGPSADG